MFSVQGSKPLLNLTLVYLNPQRSGTAVAVGQLPVIINECPAVAALAAGPFPPETVPPFST